MLFEKVIGHDKQKKLFSTSIENKTIGNAYMFTGIEGIGKQLFATELVKAINCTDSGDFTPCNNCINCKRISDRNFPDFLQIEPESGKSKKTLKIEQIRELIRETSYFPVEAQKRVVVVNDAHLMTTQAANAFLKTLEDSSEHTTFILIVTETKNLPQTVLSRCQIIKFAPLSTDEISQILTSNNEEFDKNIIENLSSGSVLKACEFSGKFSIDNLTEVFDQFSEIKTNEFSKIFKFTEELTAKYKEFSDLILIFKILFQDVLRHNMQLDLKFLSQNTISPNHTNYVNIVKKIASNNTLNIIYKKLELLSKIEMEQRFNLNKKLSVEKMMLSLL